MISAKKILSFFFASSVESSAEYVPNPDSKIPLEEIRKFLPTFLSQDSESAFLDEIRYFLNNSEKRPFYTDALRVKPIIFQGDGLQSLLVINLPDTTTKLANGMVLSNTCDISPSNERLFKASLCYAPIFSLSAYLEALRRQFPEERVASHERDIRTQSITQIFFLPQGGKLPNDAIVFLDRIVSVTNDTIDRESLADRRLFSLSDFGAWLFTLKLSIHFCRIRDKVDRTAGVIV